MKPDLEAGKNALLASVSRSFYLTIRALPAPLRQPIRTAYLLARATDTIADTAEIPAAERLKHLRLLARCIAGEEPLVSSREIGGQLAEWQNDPSERLLLSHLPEILADLQNLPDADAADIREVLAHIVHGQQNDLLTFPESSAVHALPDDVALEEYTWLVAGCVGEFWTKLCARKLEKFALRPTPEMLRLGRDYGKGLQLVNILRDLPDDLAKGRCYLPVEPKVAEIDAVWPKWLQRAHELLAAGWEYVLALQSWRLRFACALPVLIGLRTLTLLREPPKGRVKISRAEVRAILWQTAWRAGSSRLLNALQTKQQAR